MSLNKVIMIGNLTRYPELSYLPSQTPVVEFGLASNRRYKTKEGEQKEDVCFVDCRCYGKQAENINQYLRRGSKCAIEGRLQLDTWTTQDGQKRSKHRIFVESCEFLDPVESKPQQQETAPPAIPDDDIPF